MSEITIKVNTEDAKSIKAAVALLMLLGATPDKGANVINTADDELDLSDLGESEEEEVVVDDAEEDDMLGDLLGDEEEEPVVTIEDMKDAFKNLISKRTKDVATAFVKDVLAKLKVKGMSEIPEDTREKFVAVLNKKAESKK